MRCPARRRIAPLGCVLLALSWMGVPACQMEGSGAPADSSAPAVAINPRENGAAIHIPARARRDEFPRRRSLAYEITGVAKGPVSPSTSEQRASAAQAAIVDALCLAVAEDRRNRGLTEADFSEEISPRLSVARRGSTPSTLSRVVLISGGTETVFETRDGVLTHPPHDIRSVQLLFDATAGRYALLGADWQPSQDIWTARVACYHPSTPRPLLAGDATGHAADGP